ncbi:MAG TPA: MerR family transcriptional regulator [Conexibacter sp.]|nr:MerR family transcriptional regulator [Conexibacter sp.]
MGERRAGELTIDELARETGMTVRNIRAHQSRGLLPPPEVRARTGWYGPEHAARLRTIQDLQAEGFNLKAIERLLSASNGANEEVLAFGRQVLTAFADEEPELATREELAARLGTDDERAFKKAERLRLIRPLGEERYEVPSPTLLRAGEELAAMGVPPLHALAVAEQVQRHTRAIADSFVRLFVDDVAGGALDPAKRTPQEWAQLSDALARLRPLASEAVRAAFQQTMTGAVERQLQKTLRA